MCDSLSTLTGPDFLDAVAEAELHAGKEVNADVFQQRAREWRQLQADHDALERRNHQLQTALDRARAAVAVPA